ncbi:MAG: HD family phosphohydrolase [Flavobacteriales bacterium]
MINKLTNVYNKNKLIFRVVIFLATVVSIVYFIPKKLVFNNEFYKNTTWQYGDLVADFDFAIRKTPEEINNEKVFIEKQKAFYYTKDTAVLSNILSKINNGQYKIKKSVKNQLISSLKKNYSKGVFQSKIIISDQTNPKIIVKDHNSSQALEYVLDKLSDIQDIKKEIAPILDDSIGKLLYEDIEPFLNNNLIYDEKLTEEIIQQKMNKISLTKGLIKRGEKIIEKGHIIDDYKFMVLDSYKKEYEQQVWNNKKQWGLTLGYFVIVALTILILFLYLYYFRKKIIQNNTQVTFLAFNIFFTVGLGVIANRFFPDLFYILPFCLQPIVIRSFFDQGTAIVTHIITILILSFLAHNNFEFLYIQLIAGIITVLTNQKLHKRVNLYVAVVKIILVYELAYLSGILIQEGTLDNLSELWKPIFHFLLSGIFTFLVLPLIYLYERIFGLMSDLSLLELSDSNHPLLRLLSAKAPGTLQHSMQVANLAEEAAIEVGGNALLVKIGAMYHDVGKISNPTFFIENQNHIVNPHDDLDPTESTKIIINHVIEGIDLAKKYRLPDRIIDFIRTHHGDSLVHYFYTKYKEKHPEKEIDIKQFKYKGPKPFSKETAILMMCDSIEAAAKSLKSPTNLDFEKLVNTIIDKQLDSGQFNNATISLKEIGQIKKVLIKRLINIYHVRIEYPE